MTWRMATCLMAIVVGGCASGPEPARVLPAPPDTLHSAMNAMAEGTRLCEVGEWADAMARYQAAVAAQPTLAEAHYNLALSFDKLGKPRLARKHYLEAANFAPGHKVIWNSPPLRRHGDIARELPTGRSSSAPLPSPLGGFGGPSY